jgi:sterol 24-C-methyltransferase
VTDFYEYGWGQSFHFGPRWKGEGFVESIKRAEYHLCSRLGMKPGMRALDVGCGVGGPMRNMAIHSGAQIDGVTINQYQVRCVGLGDWDCDAGRLISSLDLNPTYYRHAHR